jgi:hypothetical protein
MLAGQIVLITCPTRYNTPQIGVMGLCHKYNNMGYFTLGDVFGRHKGFDS